MCIERCFRMLTIYLEPVLPATAERVARELFVMDRPTSIWSDLLLRRLTASHQYKHLMQRVDAKQTRRAVRAARRSSR